MALSKKDLQELGGLIDKAIKRAVDIGRKSGTNHYKETERRLFRYPELKKNIEEYKADIEDIKQENLGKSKDIIKFSIHGGNTPQEDIEEKRQKLIENLESRIASDSFEIRQIERALPYQTRRKTPSFRTGDIRRVCRICVQALLRQCLFLCLFARQPLAS